MKSVRQKGGRPDIRADASQNRMAFGLKMGGSIRREFGLEIR
jgi:hypothetical protein